MLENPDNSAFKKENISNHPDYDAAVESFAKRISLSHFSSLKSKIDEFQISGISDELKKEVLLSPDVSTAIEKELIQKIQGSVLGRLKEVFDTFQEFDIPEDVKKNIINNPKITSEVKKEFLSKVEGSVLSRFKDVFQIFNDIPLPSETKEQIINSPEVTEEIKKEFISKINGGVLSKYKELLAIFEEIKISEDTKKAIQNSTEAFEAFRKEFHRILGGTSFTKLAEPFDVLKQIGLPEEIYEKLLREGDIAEKLAEEISKSYSKPEEKVNVVVKLPSQIFEKVFNHNIKDRDFFSSLIKTSDQISAENLDFLEKDYILKTYKKDIGIPHFETYNKYIELKKSGDEMLLQGFIAENKKFVGSMIGSERFDDSRRPPYYKDYVDLMYPNNSTQWTSYEKNEKCEDRTQDIEGYIFPKKGYEIELLSGRSMILPEGETIEPDQVGKIESLFKTKEEGNPPLEGEELAKLNKNEQAGLLFLKTLVNEYPIEKLKELFLSRHQEHEAVSAEKTLEDLKTKAGSATNQEYAYLLSLREFFVDNIKETMSSILEEGLESPNIKPLLEKFYKEKRIYDKQQEQKQKVAQLRPETIGMEGNLAYRVNQILQQKSENFNLLAKDENGNTVLDKKGLAIERLIDNEHIRAAQVVEILTGEKIDPKDVYLGDFSIDKYLTYKEEEIQGKYDEKLFTTYLSQLATSLFENEVKIIDKELKKFRSADEDGSNMRRKKVIAYITKNKPSAHARQVGGICVAGDLQMWNDPKFFQMVFKDPDQVDCKGLVMLHAYEDQGKKILTASMNPSSTYLYSTDEKVFFDGIARTLGEFAQSNGFDMVALSKVSAIRTNRTGGTFEKSMNEKIKQVGESYHLSKPENFSYSRTYTEQDLDVIWKKS